MSILKAISVTVTVVTTRGDFRTGDFRTGGREYNMTGWHVSPLHHGAFIKSSRAPVPCQQTKTMYDSIEKAILKSQTLKYGTPRFLPPRQLPATPHQSISRTPTPSKSVDTFRPSVSVELVVISLMPSPRRLPL